MTSGLESADALLQLATTLRRLHALPVGRRGRGIADFDRELWRIGEDWLTAHGFAVAGGVSQGPDVYVATQIYRDGGHTALIGDFVEALTSDVNHSRPPHLIITNLLGEQGAIDEELRTRVAVPAERIEVLPGPSIGERLDQLFASLVRLRPARLFLFHHPDDPLPVAAARPEIARQRVLVHHADARASFGLHLPGMQLIDLNPIAAAASRLQGLTPALLRLTVPDPGPRPVGFLGRGKLVTATSGRQSKFEQPHFYTYPSTVAVILSSTGGWHVHIGALSSSSLDAIWSALQKSGVPRDRFIHVPWAPSVARTLWNHACDVYVSSFPVDGARTNVEVMASATPHLRYAAHPEPEALSEMAAAGSLSWSTWEDLAGTLRDLENHFVLSDRARRLRAAYETSHHPRVFKADLRRILEEGSGAVDRFSVEQDLRALRGLANASASSVLMLAEQLNGRGLKAKLLRWLFRP